MKRNRGWLWYFLVVFSLAVLGTGWLVVFNLSLQLTQEQLTYHRDLWQAKRPADYDLAYTIKKDEDTQGLHYAVRVRGGKVVQVLEEGLELPYERATEFSMEAIFDLIQKNLDHDSQPGQPRVYARVRFHDDNGAVLEYVRNDKRTRNRLEIGVKSFRFGQDL